MHYFFSILVLSILQAVAVETLTTAASIARHPGIDPKDQPPVSIEAIVTFVDSSGTVFMADETGATFLSQVENLGKYAPGQVLAVKGTRNPGLFIGGIKPSQIEIVGNSPLPPPLSVTLQELASGRFHYQLVSIAGVVRGVGRRSEDSAILRLSVAGGEISVNLDRAPIDANSLIDARVLATGLAAGGINDRRQLVSPYLKVASVDSLTVLERPPKNPPQARITDLALLARADLPSHRVTVSGTALSGPLHGSIFIRGESGATRVLMASEANVAPGTSVTAIGFPAISGYSPRLEDAEIKPTDQSAKVDPLPVSSENVRNGLFDGELVVFEAILLSSTPPIAKFGDQEITLLLPEAGFPMPEPGGRVRLKGIWQITSSTVTGYNSQPSSFSLWLRDPDDLRVISSAPWWTTRRLAILLTFISAGGFLALVWAAQLRLLVGRQVRTIREQTHREGIREERTRIAREFHDTLEQEFAGLSIRLDAALTRVTDVTARGLLADLRTLLVRLQTETRDFILDLRRPEDSPLHTSLDELVSHLQQISDIPISLESCPVALPPHARHHLLRIAREAIHNSVKYSGASGVAVKLTKDALTVADDGRGFDPSSTSGRGFGLQGIRERCKKMGAAPDIISSPGKGTTIRIIFPAQNA